MSEQSDGSLKSESNGPKRVGRLQIRVRTLIVLVACCGAILWAWRNVSENNDPVRAEAGSIQKRAIGALQSGKPAERLTAIVELERLRFGDSSIAIPPLIGALEDPVAAVRIAAADALGSIGSSVVKSGSGGETVRATATALIRCLKDPEPDVRSTAANSLGEIASPELAFRATSPIDRTTVMDALAETLGDRDAKVRLAVIHAMASHPLRSGDPPKALAQGLKDESAEVRAAAISGLTPFRQGLDPWFPMLLQLAEHDPDPSVRGQCLNTLSYAFKPPAVTAAVIPALIASLRSADAKVRSQDALLLGEHRADARAAIPELLRVLNEPLDPHVAPVLGPSVTLDPASAAASALGRIAPGSAKAKEVIAALMEVARSGPLSRRGWVAYALGEFGSAAEEAVPVLIKVINDTTPDDKLELEAYAALALGKIAPDTPSADKVVAVLRTVLQSKASFSRLMAIEALRQFEPGAAAAIPRIRALKDDPNPEVRNAAAKALRAIENESAP